MLKRLNQPNPRHISFYMKQKCFGVTENDHKLNELMPVLGIYLKT